jgi:hypothetical protein
MVKAHDPSAARNGNQPNGTRPANNDAVEGGETKPADHIDSRTTP